MNGDEGMIPMDDQVDTQPISWSASEYVKHHKNISWFMVLGGVSAVITFIAYILTRDFIAAASVFVVIALFGVYSTKSPAEETYTLDDQGVWVGDQLYMYESFESFSIVHDGLYESIYLTTNHRFKVPLNLYFPPAEGQRIFDRLSIYIPFSDKDMSLTDTVMARLKF